MNISSQRRLDDQFIAELDRIAAWLVQQGVRRQNRFQLYRQNLAWPRAHDLESDRAQVYADFEKRGRITEVLSTFVETMEMVETVPTLMDAGVVVPVELLKRAFSGPVDTFRENARSNLARNAMFELTMGAMAARRELNTVLSTHNPDVQFEFENRRVSLECKRVISDSKVFERIEEGIEQLSGQPWRTAARWSSAAMPLQAAPSSFIFRSARALLSTSQKLCEWGFVTGRAAR